MMLSWESQQWKHSLMSLMKIAVSMAHKVHPCAPNAWYERASREAVRVWYTIMGVEDSDLPTRADLHPVSQIQGCLTQQGVQH